MEQSTAGRRRTDGVIAQLRPASAVFRARMAVGHGTRVPARLLGWDGATELAVEREWAGLVMVVVVWSGYGLGQDRGGEG